MSMNRRKFLASGLAGGLSGGVLLTSAYGQSEKVESRYAKLDEVLAQPVFKQELFKDPIIIESVELLKKDRSYLCRVRSTDGAEGISVAHNTMSVLYPIFLNRLQGFFVGQDARRMDRLVEKVLEYKLNFRLGGLVLGRIAGKPVGQLLGTIHNTHIPVYQATEWREKPVEESVALIKAAVENSRAQAVKIKVGALMFMTKDPDARGPAGRTEAIIPLIRETFGPDMALYADANGYYQDPEEAIRVGKLLQKYNYRYFEEPVYFDWLDGTKEVADALSIPIAGGEQQHSMYSFRWLLANDGLDVVQPDHYYFGGLIRSLKAARMGEALGKKCIPHLSGGFGYIYMLQLVSLMPNAGDHIEFKGYEDLPIECKTSSLRLRDGKIKVPTGPGIGVEIDPDWVKKYRPIENV
ncbi:MAG: mandelate racemase/muconate lactonizing enzyme family protein [Opitutae bacterium]|nr:mandelate racemase/muconate lactonizing enzyme family protein [Opitutae bacterium]